MSDVNVGSKSGSLGQDKNGIHSRGQSLNSIFKQLFQNMNFNDIQVIFTLHQLGAETRSPDQILEKACIHSRL